MSSIEKVVYFLVAFVLYVSILLTGAATRNIDLLYGAIALSLLESAHWYYGLKHKKTGMWFWGLCVVTGTMAMLISMTIGINF